MKKLSKRTYILIAISIIMLIYFIGMYNFRKPIIIQKTFNNVVVMPISNNVIKKSTIEMNAKLFKGIYVSAIPNLNFHFINRLEGKIIIDGKEYRFDGSTLKSNLTNIFGSVYENQNTSDAFWFKMNDLNSLELASVGMNSALPKMYQQLTKNVYKNKKITINYPQIINYGDNTKQESINKIIKSEALKALNYYEGSTNEVTLDINYIIKTNGGNFLSVQYSGVGYSKSGADPNNLFYTTNLIFDKGNKLRLKDLIKIDENFVNIFKRSAYKSQEIKPHKSLQEAAKAVVQQYTTADLIKIFNNADSSDNIGTKNQPYAYNYLTKDSLGISVIIGRGNYAVFEIKFEDILDYIKAKEQVWITFS